jgi:inner membrane protein
MPTIMSHAVAAIAIQQAVIPDRLPARFWFLSIGCAMLPDIDVIGFAFGIRYGDTLGHRGLTHSFAFAMLTALVAGLFAWSASVQPVASWIALVIYFFVVTASHPLLDAMTNGGLGVAFFAPFTGTRYFCSWRPIEVSPIGFGFFSSRGLAVLWSEIKWIWVPSALVIIVAQLVWNASKR